MSTEITLSGLSIPTITITPEAQNRRELALKQAEGILAVNTPESQAEAVKAMQSLKSVAKGVESSRELVKKPVLEISRLIDGTAKDFVATINTELKRLDVLVSEFQRKEADRVAEIHRQQEAERIRVMREQEALVAKLEAEASAATSAAKKLAALAALEESNTKAEAAIVQSHAMSITTAPERVAGMVVRKQWSFRIIDIKKVAAVRPDWVILSENTAVINAMIRQAGIRECDGMEIFEEVKTSVRT